ncbi:MAG: hypothetical protein KJ747_04565 [Actinobacteria bacterium]|nr:hypothetical protein [Actinomycetota bacterium]MCG2807497.1 hypothetical protein [Coriobacteriia bacterium]
MNQNAMPVKPRSRVLLATVLVVVTVAVFAGAVVWAGGVDAVAELLGLDLGGATVVANDPGTAKPATGSEEPSVASSGSADATASADTTVVASGSGDGDADDPKPSSGPGASASIPISSAQAAMYREQLQSQAQIIKLVDGEITSVGIGTSSSTTSRANIPLSVSYKTSSAVSGTMVLANTDGLWYFSSISAGGGSAAVAKPRTVDSGVVNTITQQQADPDCQALIEEGLIEGGFKSARVDGVSKGAGTATVNVTLQGGTLDRKAARFVLISKTDSGNKYWFLTRFELK